MKKEILCTCEEPHISGMVIHCYDGKPCYLKPVVTPEQDNWKEKFDKEFQFERLSLNGYDDIYQLNITSHPEDIKSFISSLLSSQAHALKEQMKKCVPEEDKTISRTGSEDSYKIQGFNYCREQTLSAIESIEI